jgi:hypothetical protein
MCPVRNARAFRTSLFDALLAFHVFDDRITVAVDYDGKHERAATDRAVLDEPLLASGRRIDADGIIFVAARARVEGIRFDRHRC